MNPQRRLTVRVARIWRQTPHILAFELTHPWGRPLPGYEAGAHIDVHMPGGFSRQYSLALAPPAAAPVMSYLIGVKREAASRGGSASMHERVRTGDLLAVSAPRNTFPLCPQAAQHLLLAGGIGITPLLAMAQALAARGANFRLCVFARSREHLAFADALRAPALAPRLRLHLDQGEAAERIDLHALLAERAPGAQLYLCGPGGFMQAVRDAARHWPEDALHAEYFAAPADADQSAGQPFTLRLAQRGISVPVAADQSAVDALRQVGIDIPVSCQQGLCGSCVVPGDGAGAEHHDFCLTASERQTRLALCCARAKGQELVLQL
ncbi:PDR/VanB family oxidoreductase [Verminephrobacter eiseniae]|uniref:Ferredoxin n=3 Tax=Verminephrobacter eiseniae TaxID=364317 RepID=A1WML5_VEREI|nr:PDR/VanB family oxidoreductase [Verminephrobacter eiseniae]ABM58872.1 ferredoxin [Verminephrobacter eiseniae EF01-2]MCW5284436.1 oxidoreductase [Verminephrobacter eiseniae]MCW5302142.1 oxidoreductase [Verminephrobacter eiseniae]MCW8191800.1 oxidoreductase [Verminephrobacter eiseniae]